MEITVMNQATKSPAFLSFLRIHAENHSKDDWRLGQRFCNMYLKNEDEVPGLFYLQDYKAKLLIQKWLDDHHYYDRLPEQVKR